MNKVNLCFFFLIGFFYGVAQELPNKSKQELGLDFFYGNILEHNPDIGHLITGHPNGFIFSYNRKTFGEQEWEHLFNYPDYGLSFVYQDMINPYLGDHYGLYGHYNFYFFNRHLIFRLAQGIAYNTKPYHPNKNYENIAYGTHLLAATYLMLNYSKKNLFKNFGLQTGFTIMHYSNGNFKAPNTSTNTLAFNLGINYQLETKEAAALDLVERKKKPFSEPIHFNLVLRSGIQTSDVIGMHQYPFYILGAYLDKRISKKSSFLLGGEIFFSQMLKELIYYRSIAYPNDGFLVKNLQPELGYLQVINCILEKLL